jgi:ribosome-binding factor A
MSSRRQEQVAQAVQQVLSQEMREMSDPRLGFVTVTEVSITPDLKTAHIYWSDLRDVTLPDAHEGSQKALEGAKGRLRAAVGARLAQRYTPQLVFHRDETGERAARIDALLRSVKPSEPSQE